APPRRDVGVHAVETAAHPPNHPAAGVLGPAHSPAARIPAIPPALRGPRPRPCAPNTLPHREETVVPGLYLLPPLARRSVATHALLPRHSRQSSWWYRDTVCPGRRYKRAGRHRGGAR